MLRVHPTADGVALSGRLDIQALPELEQVLDRLADYLEGQQRLRNRVTSIIAYPLAMMGFDPVPNYTAPEEPPPGMFRLLIGRSSVHTFSRTTNNRFLAQCHSENEIWINADAAKAVPGFENASLKSGDKVVLENQDGVRSNAIKVKVTERIRGDCVYMVHGFGRKIPWQTRGYNKGLADYRFESGLLYHYDPVGGAIALCECFVKVEKAS